MATDKTIKPMKPNMPKKVLGGPIADDKQKKLQQGPLHGVKTHNQERPNPWRSGGK